MKNIIIFAAGGGNDIFSALAYRKVLISENIDVYIIGVLGLTPLHTNNPSYMYEDPLIKPTSQMHRYLLCDPIKEISNNERLFPDLANKFAIKDYVCISPKYSAIYQANELRKLFTTWGLSSNNAIIHIVDFGGDILTDGTENSPPISPELDAYTLAVVKNLQEYQYTVIICFPGVDGELSNDYLRQYCSDAEKHDVDKEKWLSALKEIKVNRLGNTIPNMIKILEGNINQCNLHKQWIINGEKHMLNIPLDIDFELQNYIYILSIDHNPFVSIFNTEPYILENIFEEICKYPIKSSDFHLNYLRKGTNNITPNGEVMYLNQVPPMYNLYQ